MKGKRPLRRIYLEAEEGWWSMTPTQYHEFLKRGLSEEGVSVTDYPQCRIRHRPSVVRGSGHVGEGFSCLRSDMRVEQVLDWDHGEFEYAMEEFLETMGWSQ